eukprot:Sspe_Gene.97918::Locus_71406_Transcript_1_1_Confidence_1.000_Length_2171::g.97918::m.97918
MGVEVESPPMRTGRNLKTRKTSQEEITAALGHLSKPGNPTTAPVADAAGSHSLCAAPSTPPQGLAPSPPRASPSSKQQSGRTASLVSAAYNTAALETPRSALVGGVSKVYHTSQQRQINLELRTKVLSDDDALSESIEQVISFVQLRPKAIADKYTSLVSAVSEFEAGYRGVQQQDGATRTALRQKLGLLVSERAAATLGSMSVPDITFLRPCLGELAASASQKLSARRWEMRKEQLLSIESLFFKGAETVTPLPIFTLLCEMYQYLHTEVLDFTRRELADLDVSLMSLEGEITAAESQRIRAKKEGKMAACQEAHIKKVKILKEQCDLCVRRVGLVTSGGKDTGSYSDNVAGLQEKGKALIKEFMEDKKSYHCMIDHDVNALRAAFDVESEENNKTCIAYEEATEAVFQKLKDLNAQQEATWNSITESVWKLQDLSKKRAELVAQHVVAKEAEEARRVAFKDFCDAQKEHLATLHQMRDLLATSETVGEEVNSFITGMGPQLRVKGTEEALWELTLVELKTHLAKYRSFLLCAGDLHHRLEQRKTSIERLLRANDIQLELAEESYDPAIQQYKDERRAREKDRADCEELMRWLSSLIDEASSDFEATSEALARKGVEFVPPMVELQSEFAVRKASLLEKTRRFVDTEQTEVEKEQSTLRKLTNLVSQQSAGQRTPSPA